MGTIPGAIKYAIFTPLTVVGFVSMYIFGGGIMTLFNTVQHLFLGDFVQAFLEYFLLSALPPASVEHVLLNVIVGTLVAAVKWFGALMALGHRLI